MDLPQKMPSDSLNHNHFCFDDWSCDLLCDKTKLNRKDNNWRIWTRGRPGEPLQPKNTKQPVKDDDSYRFLCFNLTYSGEYYNNYLIE